MKKLINRLNILLRQNLVTYMIWWISVLLILISAAIFSFCKGLNELGTGILTLSGGALSLPFFSIPFEIEKEKSLIVNNKRIEGYEKIFFLLVHIEDHFKFLVYFEDKEKRAKYNSDYHKLFDLMTEYGIYINKDIYNLLLNVKDTIETLDFSTLCRSEEKINIEKQKFILGIQIEQLRNKLQNELGIF